MPIGIVHTSTFIALAMVPTTVFILHSCVSGRSGGPVMPRQTISGISSVGNLGDWRLALAADNAGAQSVRLDE